MKKTGIRVSIECPSCSEKYIKVVNIYGNSVLELESIACEKVITCSCGVTFTTVTRGDFKRIL